MFGHPKTPPKTMKNLHQIIYGDVSFFFDAESEYKQLSSVAFSVGYDEKRFAEFKSYLPPEINFGASTQMIEKILGEPTVIKEGDDYTWFTYNNEHPEWRHYWMRFREGKLEMINLSTTKHGASWIYIDQSTQHKR